MPSCGAETHLVSSHQSPGDWRDDASDTGASRAWGPHRPQPAPKTPLEASDEARNEPEEECLDSTIPGRSRALVVTKRHKTPRFAFFASRF